MDSKSILREIQGKNRFVFKRLFEAHYAELVQYAKNYLFDSGQSEDVVQEVFIQLWEKSATIKVEHSLKRYLYVMVRNRCLNELKAIKISDQAKVLDLQSIIAADYELDVFSDEDLQIIHHRLLQIVDALPPKMREIVKLRFIENYKYMDIAEEMGVSVNTVKTQLKRAKIKISQEMAILLIALITEI